MSSNSDSPLPLRSRQLIPETPIKLIWEDRESTSPVKATKNKKKTIPVAEEEKIVERSFFYNQLISRYSRSGQK
jgi:hypothetical protein